jgi:hypothetical protein
MRISIAAGACLAACGLALQTAAQQPTAPPPAQPAARQDQKQQEATPAKQPADTRPAQRGLPLGAAATPKPKKTQAELEADFSKMLSGATLEGSFTMTGAGGDAARLSRDKYSLGDVKKLAGNIWLIHATIQYGGNNYNAPLPLPVVWAGDTPMIVVDEVTIPGHGTFTARVMFYDDHYAGYWKHGDRGGNMFGVVNRGAADAALETTPEKAAAADKSDKADKK